MEVGTGPTDIVIIRHGEKSEDSEDLHLNLKGYQRALALAYRLPAMFFIPKIIAVYAAGVGKDSASHRSCDTVEPLVRRLENLGVAVQFYSKYLKGDYKDMANDVLKKMRDGVYLGKVVIICWEHDKIPEIVVCLGGPQTSNWADDCFERVWVLEYTDPASMPRLIEKWQ